MGGNSWVAVKKAGNCWAGLPNYFPNSVKVEVKMTASSLTTTVKSGVLVACFESKSLDELSETLVNGARLRAVAEQAPDGRMLLDFQHVEFLDSSMLGQLFALRKHCGARNIVVKACGLSENLQKLFEIVRLVDFVEIYENVEEGIQKFEKPAPSAEKPAADIAALQNAAEQGDAEACFELASHYEDGHGVEQSPAKALEYYQKAADAGLAAAQYRVGLAHAYGIETQQDYDEAIKWYTPAAEQGHREAQYALGMAYQYDLVKNDEPGAAARWYGLAADQGHKMAKEELKRC